MTHREVTVPARKEQCGRGACLWRQSDNEMGSVVKRSVQDTVGGKREEGFARLGESRRSKLAWALRGQQERVQQVEREEGESFEQSNRFKDRQGQRTLDGNCLAWLRSGKGPWEIESGVEARKEAEPGCARSGVSRKLLKAAVTTLAAIWKAAEGRDRQRGHELRSYF